MDEPMDVAFEAGSVQPSFKEPFLDPYDWQDGIETLEDGLSYHPRGRGATSSLASNQPPQFWNDDRSRHGGSVRSLTSDV
jgi:hypothetical protein